MSSFFSLLFLIFKFRSARSALYGSKLTGGINSAILKISDSTFRNILRLLIKFEKVSRLGINATCADSLKLFPTKISSNGKTVFSSRSPTKIVFRPIGENKILGLRSYGKQPLLYLNG